MGDLGEFPSGGISRETFVRLGALLGVSAAGASVLAACAYDPERAAKGRTTAAPQGHVPDGRTTAALQGHVPEERTTAAPQGHVPEERVIARVTEVHPGTALGFEDPHGNPAVLVRLRDGDFVAYSAVCTHEGCVVAYDSDRWLACPCHGSVFDPAEGARVVEGPARWPLPKIAVEVRGGKVVRGA